MESDSRPSPAGICPQCGQHVYDRRRKFCPDCRVRLGEHALARAQATREDPAATCERCGNELKPYWRLCAHCGLLIGGPYVAGVSNGAMKRGRSVAMIVSAGVGGVIAVMALIILALGGGEEDVAHA